MKKYKINLPIDNVVTAYIILMGLFFYSCENTIIDNSIENHLYGCTDLDANNYDEDASLDNGSCEYSTDFCILGNVYISEAANVGDPEDYIEVYNGGSFECTLYGFQLDDSEDLEDFTFGNVILSPGAYWLGYEDEDDSFGSGLSSSGDIVVLADAIGNTLTVTLEESIEVDGIELSQSFISDGTGCYTLPTPSEINGECFDIVFPGEINSVDSHE